LKLVPQNRCLRGHEHDIDLAAGSLEFDDGGDHAYLSVPCFRCGAWAMISVKIVELAWGKADDGVCTAPRPNTSSSELK